LTWFRGAEFRVILTSTFEKDDVVEFLENSIPLEKLQIINITTG
jgi:hypothetical protein